MAHYAKINNGIVEKVIVAEADFFDSFVDTSAGEWIQTSYNTKGGKHYVPNSNWEIESDDQTKALRKNYACIGDTYDATRDAFYRPQPYPSWTLNEDTCFWEAPVAYPIDGQNYTWNEETQSWDIKE